MLLEHATGFHSSESSELGSFEVLCKMGKLIERRWRNQDICKGELTPENIRQLHIFAQFPLNPHEIENIGQ